MSQLRVALLWSLFGWACLASVVVGAWLLLRRDAVAAGAPRSALDAIASPMGDNAAGFRLDFSSHKFSNIGTAPVELHDVRTDDVAIPLTWSREERPGTHRVLLTAQRRVTENGVWWAP